MRFLLDNDVPDVVARVLMEASHDVLLLRNVMPKKSSDLVVLDYAAANRLLLNHLQSRRLHSAGAVAKSLWPDRVD